MFFLSRSDLDKKFKQLRLELQSVGISDELRGWSWENYPVSSPHKGLLLSVSELASRYCDTFRDIYLRRVECKLPPPSLKMFEGIVYHFIASESTVRVKKFIFDKGLVSGSDLIEALLPQSKSIAEMAIENTESNIGKIDDNIAFNVLNKASKLYRFLIVQAASQLDRALTKFPHIDVDSLINLAIPPIVERKVDGSLIGLSKELSVDIYAPAYAVADIKTGEVRNFHKYALTGYALALEADEETAVNFGLTIYVRMEEDRPVPTIHIKHYLISDELRREFLEIRDEAFEIVMNKRDPGKPSTCPSFCPYYQVCN
ncbi:MAG: type I-A CRISPR-associated protein Cas4/Csa1 [Nitrososphaerales archaeon]